jgi:hypothetical protein
MSTVYPITLFALVGLVWLVTAVQCAKLFNAFLKKYPQEAQSKIPHATSRLRHPEKVLFFFRNKSLPLLKADPNLWKLRQRLKVLLLLSVALPFLGFALLACTALTRGF